MRSLSLKLRCNRAATFVSCGILALTVAAAQAPMAMSATIGGSSALSELTQGGQETTTTAANAATSATTESSSNSSTVIILALVAAVALLIGIAYVIIRDARRVAPAGDGPLAGGSSHDPAVKLRRRRAKAKAARRQRKRNR